MNVFEMEGFLRGKYLPGDMKVNETTAEYLVRKLGQAGELTAALSTLEKAREVTNCPVGVELQDYLKQLVAESLAIKAMNDCLAEELRGYESDGAFDGPNMHLLWWKCETPATDSILREVGARGIESVIEIKRQQLNGLHPDTFAIGAVRDSLRRDIYELKILADVMRNELLRGGKAE
jgi:hypothetical protein